MAHETEIAAKPVHQAETTFKNYNSEDAKTYAAYRPSYAPKLIEIIVNSHKASNGEMELVMDIGCGPGIATRQIASHFRHAIGIDASPAMIETAQKTTCLSGSGEQATFKVCASEDIDQYFEPNSVDMITVATAAHWFDMPRFYAAASKVLKPSGSIAMWCGGRWFPDPRSTPNLEAIKELWSELELKILRPYETRGNVISRELYKDLDLPWTIDPSSQPPEVANALSQYDQSTSLRREFNTDGIPDPSPDFAETNGFLSWVKVPLEGVAKMIGTSSPVTRWREAHQEQLKKGEIEDCVDQMMNATRAEFAKAGPEGAARTWVEVGISAVLIIVKKKA